MRRAIFRTSFGQRNRDQLSIQRGDVEVECDRAAFTHGVRINHSLFRGGLIRRRQHYQESLLLRGLKLHGKQNSATLPYVEILSGAGRDQLLQPLLDGRARWQVIEIFASAGVLCRAPSFDHGIVPIFQPAIVVNDLHSLIGVGHRVSRRGRRCRNTRRLGESENREQNDCAYQG